MGEPVNSFAALLQAKRLVAADTMVFIYHVQDHPRYTPFTEQLFSAWEEGTVAGVTSVLTLLELLVKPLMDDHTQAVADYKELLTTFPNLTLAPVNEIIADRAAALRARYGLRTPDAIQIATAIWAGAGMLVTNDRALARVREVTILTLEELAEATPPGSGR